MGARDGWCRGRAAWIVAAALVVLAGLAFLLIGERLEPSRRSPRSIRPPAAPATGQLVPAALSSGAERSAQRSVPEQAPVEAALKTAEDPPSLRVAGCVVEGASVEPVAGAHVTLDAPEDLVRATADERGRFELALRADCWELGRSYRAVVTLSEDQRLFAGNVVLEPEMLIRVRTRLVLRGRLETSTDLVTRRVAVMAHAPPRGTVHASVYAVRAALDADGRFAIEAWVDRVPDTFELTFHGGSLFLRTDVATAELASDDGATVVYLFGELEIRCEDEAGDAVPFADVNAADERGSTGTSTGDDGIARLALGSGGHDVSAVAPGHAPAVARIEMDGQDRTETLVLRRLRDDEKLAGTVLDPRGEPVEGALVTASYVTDRGLRCPMQELTTGAQGDFELSVGGDLSVQVVAHEERYGRTPEVVVELGVHRVTLRFEPKGSLLVDLTGISGDAGAVAAVLEWVLVRTETGKTLSSHDWTEPFRVDDLPEGEYQVFVFLRQAGLLASGRGVVRGGREETIMVPVDRASFVEGALVRADGSRAPSLNLRLISTDLPDPVIEHWGKASTDVQGSFGILVGPSGAGEAAVFDLDGNELGRIELLPGRRTYRLAP